MNFLTKIEFLKNCEITQDIRLHIDELLLEDEMKQKVVLKEKDITFEPIFYKNDKTTYCELLLIDSNKKIEELIGEEYQIKNLEIYFMNSKKEELPFRFISSLEFTEIESLKSDIVFDFLNGLNKEEAVFITGSSPAKLFGYDLSVRDYQILASEIYCYLEKKILQENLSIFVTSGRLGIETITFFVIQKLKEKYPNIYNILTIPCLKFDAKWDKTNKERYQRMLQLADSVIEVDKLMEYKNPTEKSEEYTNEKVVQKNIFINNTTKGNINITRNNYGEIKFGSYRNSYYF